MVPVSVILTGLERLSKIFNYMHEARAVPATAELLLYFLVGF